MSDFDLFESDTEDVIPDTPEQIRGKKLVHRLDHCSVKYEAQKNHLEDSCNLIRRQTVVPKSSNSEDLNPHLERKKPFVFYSIQNILNFSTDSLPLNNKLRTVGIFKQKDTNTSYLLDFRKCSSLKILISFELVEQVPNVNAVVEIFGSIKLEKLGSNAVSLPVFVVHLWKYRFGNILEYVDKLNRLKQFVYSEHKVMANDDLNSSTYLETSVNINLYLDSLNDSVLNKVVDNVENVSKNFKRIIFDNDS